MRSKSILVAMLLCLLTTKVYAIVFDDGGTHNIDYTLTDHVYIYSVETFWEQIPTTVNVNGAIGGSCYVNDNSYVKMYAGSIGGELFARENSQIDFFDGYVVGTLGACNHSRINMSGGELNSGITLEDFGIAYVSGGTTHGIAIRNESKIYISGSSNVDLLIAHNNSFADISGGVLKTLKIIGNANADLSGGTIEENIIIHDNSRLTIYGDDFQVDGVSVGFGTFGVHEGGAERHGLLTGTLANGDVLNNEINIFDNAQLILTPAPEPTDPPIAHGGEDIIADANEAVVLDANASYDPDGYIIQYTWTALPENVILYSGQESALTTKALGRVEEVIKLTVTDNDGASSEDTVSIFNRRVEEIELTPGPQGPAGPQGPQGEQGEQGTPGITPAEISQMQEQITALQQANSALQQQVQALQQQNELLQQKVDENRSLLEQLPQLKKRLEELMATVPDETP